MALKITHIFKEIYSKKSSKNTLSRKEFLLKTFFSLGLITIPPLIINACSSNTSDDGSSPMNSNNTNNDSDNNNTTNINDNNSNDTNQCEADDYVDTYVDNYDENSDVYVVKNGDCFQNISKLFELMGGIESFIDADDYVVIKGNGQWIRQGYTHTGCIKAVIDEILSISGYSGEIYICDNVQTYGNIFANTAFNTEPGTDREHNWPDHNWTTLAQEFQSEGKPVAAVEWINGGSDITGPADGAGWVRDYFMFKCMDVFLSYPIFESPLTSGLLVDMKNGIWQNGGYNGKNVKVIFMPNLNNHGEGSEDYAGVTSAVKSFFGITEIPGGITGRLNGYRNIHCASFTQLRADYAGMLCAYYIKNLIKPDLYITTAMWSGHDSRMGDAVETKTVLACRNPATLDYVACKDIISPYATFLNPDNVNNTRKQIMGCLQEGIGTIDENKYSKIEFDFNS